MNKFISHEKLNTDEYKYYLLVPIQASCSPCLDSTISYINKNVNKKNVMYVLSGHGEKDIKFRFSKNVLQNKNVHIDKKSLLLIYGITDFNPVFVNYKNGDILSFDKLMPGATKEFFSKINNVIN